MSEFRNRGVEVVVDTTRIAELDFADNYVSEAEQERIARNLKHVLRSESDLTEGMYRLREVIDGWEAIFTHYRDANHYVVLIVGYGKKGEMESTLRLVARAGFEQFAPAINVILDGKKRK
ncbi:hypothetical protein [Paracoccus spongiarum]|uniref:Uncharacterized protein n=1 Tax=Paracoccus spongiarum TaxID=3064387 RepID=A0ABT9JHA3_9RHOB|nr:hypothetical protein [Paracoccus sp. 2205BS29-5]MDP5309218.1 hypothetical protein [Paracoccus sp. 2205BS29-5]